ncbi:hypothetical protein G7Y89_g7505 [Cudoniella acicularis]|uniref:Uncharacterized protein n=1 Tax=Cudoniella acicularis TaxID=354080 RepID=A0A8H4RIF2_9HELO|nr:hypothetical protein G7Y89_g7505 [Cudoniella acicularis]
MGQPAFTTMRQPAAPSDSNTDRVSVGDSTASTHPHGYSEAINGTTAPWWVQLEAAQRGYRPVQHINPENDFEPGLPYLPPVKNFFQLRPIFEGNQMTSPVDDVPQAGQLKRKAAFCGKDAQQDTPDTKRAKVEIDQHQDLTFCRTSTSTLILFPDLRHSALISRGSTSPNGANLQPPLSNTNLHSQALVLAETIPVDFNSGSSSATKKRALLAENSAAYRIRSKEREQGGQGVVQEHSPAAQRDMTARTDCNRPALGGKLGVESLSPSALLTLAYTATANTGSQEPKEKELRRMDILSMLNQAASPASPPQASGINLIKQATKTSPFFKSITLLQNLKHLHGDTSKREAKTIHIPALGASANSF